MQFQEPIRVTYLINTLSIGGAERGMARLLSGLSSDRFDITVVALATRGGGIVDQLPSHVRVIDLQMDSPLDILRARKIWTTLSETDMLITSLYHATQLGRILGTLRRVPLILSWQHSERLESTVRQRLFGLLSVLDTRVLADSRAAAAGAEKCGVNPTKIRRVPIAGIDLDEYPLVTHGSRERIHVGTLGRLTPEKNMRTVLDVAKNLSDRDVEFHIGGLGPQRDALEQYVTEEEIDNASFAGLIKDVPGFLNGLDIYIQPSHREGLCLTVVEAMAAGLPIVASNVGGITETVVPGETGVLEVPSAMDAFTQHLLKLSSDPDRRARYGAAGRERVAENYSRQRLVEAFLDVIEEV